MPGTLRVSEELTRKEMIDPQLEKAGWYLNPKLKHINSNSKTTRGRTWISTGAVYK
jgi:type I site-specific restriction endonuclease